ncbi:MAG: hypothetical protein PHE89_00970 [Alphaproteobacteria bacterium]|nr:hypothetical protein [Alphaproteobacteria bacterium]
MRNKKVFIFDVDGVLLNLWQVMRCAYEDFHQIKISEQEWEDVIDDFLHNPVPYLDFGNYFDNSNYFGSLPPLSDEMLFLPANLRASGFDVAIVTSTNDAPEIVEARRENLRVVYGDVFSEILFVGRAQSKEKALMSIAQKYEMSYFCDDSLKNVVNAKDIVTFSIWFENKHHLFMLKQFDVTNVFSANGVDEIEQIVKSTSDSFRKIIRK